MGKIESGHVQVGESVLLLPANEITNIKCTYSLQLMGELQNYNVTYCHGELQIHYVAITVCDEVREWAVAGDQVLFNLVSMDISNIR